jgi:proteasome lid subunit RPN8/RPN11
VAEINAMTALKNSPLLVPTAVVAETLAFLRRAGDRESEAVVLWLGRKEPRGISVTEAYVPAQEAACDYFRIPPAAMAALLTHLGDSGMFVAGQVHSHPREGFHSEADDTWAIVRHLGALSLVVPSFARDTVPANFVRQIAAFRLDATNIWQELEAADRERSIEIA